MLGLLFHVLYIVVWDVHHTQSFLHGAVPRSHIEPWFAVFIHIIYITTSACQSVWPFSTKMTVAKNAPLLDEDNRQRHCQYTTG